MVALGGGQTGLRRERLLLLRCVLINGQWDDFVNYVATSELRLPSQPLPARPYDAKLKEAA